MTVLLCRKPWLPTQSGYLLLGKGKGLLTIQTVLAGQGQRRATSLCLQL